MNERQRLEAIPVIQASSQERARIFMGNNLQLFLVGGNVRQGIASEASDSEPRSDLSTLMDIQLRLLRSLVRYET